MSKKIKDAEVIEDVNEDTTGSDNILLTKLKEATERLRTTSELSKNLKEENDSLKAEIAEYAELMETADSIIAEKEEALAAKDKDEAEIRTKIEAEKISDQIQAALKYKNKVVEEANNQASNIIAKAKADAEEKARDILIHAEALANKHITLAQNSQKQYLDVLDKIELLKSNLAATLDAKEQLVIAPVQLKQDVLEFEEQPVILDPVSNKEPEQPKPVFDKDAEVIEATSNKADANTEPQSDKKSANKWQAVSNSRASQAAKRLRERAKGEPKK